VTAENKTRIPKSLLGSKALAHVVTVGPCGGPQSSPVWFGRDGEYVKFSQTEKDG
jgi:hypothetical protein